VCDRLSTDVGLSSRWQAELEGIEGDNSMGSDFTSSASDDTKDYFYKLKLRCKRKACKESEERVRLTMYDSGADGWNGYTLTAYSYDLTKGMTSAINSVGATMLGERFEVGQVHEEEFCIQKGACIALHTL
jgi:hypothetical protein